MRYAVPPVRGCDYRRGPRHVTVAKDAACDAVQNENRCGGGGAQGVWRRGGSGCDMRAAARAEVVALEGARV
eukprot:scaffold20310_cov125-Isochrysis_galbana.AAC.16